MSTNVLLISIDSLRWDVLGAYRESPAEDRMRDLLVEGLDALEAPEEQYRRLGLA